ncbi:hypothetical protein B0H17DRAFT_1205318 [Mycena rosella]|uniref:Uncharacterized protein n=1 Tax=Mycena rosella TaxID=1033263 RepID=A0AAD7D780_MYCRO|nr:hypothetical protein B0H17DRAFT_1205318 [Mycena rosella]
MAVRGPRKRKTAKIRDILDAAYTRIADVDASVLMFEGIIEKLRRTREDAHPSKQHHLAYLERSSTCGLTVYIEHRHTEAIGLLVDCSTRWEMVDIDMGPSTLPILERVRGRVPMLRDLTYTDSNGSGTCGAFEVAPRLSSATIIGNASLHLPWPRITRLRLYRMLAPPNKLASARNLESLSLVELFGVGAAWIAGAATGAASTPSIGDAVVRPTYAKARRKKEDA